MNDAFWQRVALLCSVSTSVCIIGADMAEPWPHLLIHLLTWYHPCHIILSSKFSLSVHWCCPWCWNPPWLHPDTGRRHAWGKRTWFQQCLWWWSRFCHPWSRSPLWLNFQWISSSGVVLEALLPMLLVLVVYATAVDNKVTITMSKIKTLLSL